MMDWLREVDNADGLRKLLPGYSTVYFSVSVNFPFRDNGFFYPLSGMARKC